MKTIITHLCFLLLSYYGYSQDVIKVTYKDNMPKYKEEVEVFINAVGDTIRHGCYKKISGRANNTGQVLATGYYKNNLPEGQWQIYGSFGEFKEGRKVGKWAYKQFLYEKTPSVTKQLLETLNTSPLLPFVSKYKIIQIYDYDKDSLIFYEEAKDIFQSYHQYTTCSPEKFDKPPVLIGSLSLIQTYITDDIKYPKQAILNKTQGVVKYGLKINEQGQVTDVVLIEGLGDGCDEVVLNAVKKYKDKFIFIPAQKAGKNIPICLELHFRFKFV